MVNMLAGVVGLHLMAAPLADPTFELTPSTTDDIGREGVFGFVTEFEVAASADQTFALLSDLERYDELFSNVSRSEIVERKGNDLVVDWVESVAFMEFKTRMRTTIDAKARRVYMRSLKEGDLVVGRFQVTALGPNRSHVRYQSWMDPGPFIPDALILSASRSLTKELVEKTRAEAPKVSLPQKTQGPPQKPQTSPAGE